MYKIFSSYIKTAFVIALFVLLAPQNSFAAELNYKVVPNVAGDNTTVVEVHINPEGKNLNVVEGSVVFSGKGSEKLSIEVDKSNSVFTMWPGEPVYNKENKTIQFVGGTPNGLTKEGLLFSFSVISASVGSLDISWSGVKTYLNDGKGTEEATSVKSTSLDLDAKNSEGLEVENNSTEDKTAETETVFPGFNITKNVRILLLIIILFSAIFYGYKKFIKS